MRLRKTNTRNNNKGKNTRFVRQKKAEIVELQNKKKKKIKRIKMS